MGDATLCGVMEFDTRLDPDALDVGAILREDPST